MPLERSFLRSKLARRIFWLFIACALLPISVLALVAWRNVSARMNEENRKHLGRLTREQAMVICERLVFLDSNLRLIASEAAVKNSKPVAGDADRMAARLTKQFDWLLISRKEGASQVLFGESSRRMEFSAEQEKFLDEGNSILSTAVCDDVSMCVLLSHRVSPGNSAEGTVVGKVKPSYLWDKESLPADLNLCVLDDTGRVLFCSEQNPPAFPAEITKTFAGEFEWHLGGTEYQAQYWNLPLSGAFFAPHWTVVASQPKSDALAELVHFRTTFLLVCLLSVWIVLLLSSVQIRRSLVPLAKLKEGTQEIAQGHFRQRVSIQSGDEFEELAGSFNMMAARIEKQLHSLKTSNEIDRAILSAWEMDKVFDTLSKRLSELLPLDLFCVAVIHGERSAKPCCYIYDRGSKKARQAQEFVLTNEEERQLSEHSEVAVRSDNEKLPSYLDMLRSRGMRYFLTAPILVEGRPAAVICLGHAEAQVWDEEDKLSARQLADQVGVALANSQLIHKLDEMHWGALYALARAIDAKSPWTLGHSERVTDFAIKLATEIGLPPKELEIMRRGGLVHDVGKIGVRAEILNKPGKLTAEEMAQMREHVNIGVRILQPIPGFSESMPIVAQHHEWLNGRGYPNGLVGEEISLHARILAVADCFDALISDRPYRPGIPLEKVIQMISDGSGTQFEPDLVEAFRKVIRREAPVPAMPVKTNETVGALSGGN